jgi:hypothetical protein
MTLRSENAVLFVCTVLRDQIDYADNNSRIVNCYSLQDGAKAHEN